MNPKGFFGELKRRNVYKVAIAYVVVAWLLIQVVTQVFPFFEIPNWTVRLVVFLLIIGFPVALILAWAFELTPAGIKRTADMDAKKSIRKTTGDKQKRPSATSTSIPEKSIAVLPFENRSEDKANAYFADGVQDEILTRLAKIADLKVISRASTAGYASAPSDLREIARQLGVANILEGSVQKAGDRVRINVRLIRAPSDHHLWAETYDRQLTDIFGVESEVAQKITTSLRATLTGNEKNALTAKPTNNPVAYDAYLRGRAFAAGSFWMASNVDGAIQSYQQAVAFDPCFTLAWARLSYEQIWSYWVGFDASPARLAAAKDAIDHALALDPDLPEVRLALGFYRYYALRDFTAALAEFRQARQGLPNDAGVIKGVAFVQRRLGHSRKPSRSCAARLRSILATSMAIRISRRLTVACAAFPKLLLRSRALLRYSLLT